MSRHEVLTAVLYLVAAFDRRILCYGRVGVAISLFRGLALIAPVSVFYPISSIMTCMFAFLMALPLSYIAPGGVSFADCRSDTFQPLRFTGSTTPSLVIAAGGMCWATEINGRGYSLCIGRNWLMIPGMTFVTCIREVSGVARNTGRTA